MSSWFRKYPDKSIGGILHFVYWYCGFHAGEYATIGENTVTLHGERIATFTFNEENVPVFAFTNNAPKDWAENQKRFREEAMKDRDPDRNPTPRFRIAFEQFIDGIVSSEQFAEKSDQEPVQIDTEVKPQSK